MSFDKEDLVAKLIPTDQLVPLGAKIESINFSAPVHGNDKNEAGEQVVDLSKKPVMAEVIYSF